MKNNEKQIQRSDLKQKESEHRRYPRHNIVLGIQGTCIDEASNNHVEFYGYTSDISIRGLSLLVKTGIAIRVGQQFQMLIQLFQGEDPVEAIGQVRWLEEVDEEQNKEFAIAGFGLLGMNTRKYDHWIDRIQWNEVA